MALDLEELGGMSQKKYTPIPVKDVESGSIRQSNGKPKTVTLYED